jgi:tripartite-type tricarboxylate transporter receptor subunit TctC
MIARVRGSGALFQVALLLAAILWCGPADAQDASSYPNQPVRIIVPFAPGGASDFAARVIQPRLSAVLGQQVIIENRAGAAGNVGMDVAARSAPDGYTLYLGNIGTVALNPHVFKDLRVKPLQDFIPVSILADMPSLLVANPKFAPSTVQELVVHAKANPGKVNFASPGSGSMDRLEMELFRKQAGIDMTHVPYKGGAGPAAADVVGGHVEIMFGTIASTMPHVRGARLKALAVTSKERVAAIPEVPTIVEAGFPEAVASSWQGILVPAGTPKPIVDKLHAAIVQTMADPDIKKRYEEIGATAVSSKSPDEFLAYIREDGKKWEIIIKETNATPD